MRRTYTAPEERTDPRSIRVYRAWYADILPYQSRTQQDAARQAQWKAEREARAADLATA